MSDNVKRLLLLTGPQGSGNHLWAKIFNSHSRVNGWDFKGQFWDGHHNEPFNKYFLEPEKLDEVEWHEYNVASVSVPFVRDKRNQIPLLNEFINKCDQLGVLVQIAVIGRDRSILSKQQIRLRGGETFHLFIEELRSLQFAPNAFLSFELLNLYRGDYLEFLSYSLDWPIDVKAAAIHIVNGNEKYIEYVETNDLDRVVKKFLAES